MYHLSTSKYRNQIFCLTVDTCAFQSRSVDVVRYRKRIQFQYRCCCADLLSQENNLSNYTFFASADRLVVYMALKESRLTRYCQVLLTLIPRAKVADWIRGDRNLIHVVYYSDLTMQPHKHAGWVQFLMIIILVLFSCCCCFLQLLSFSFVFSLFIVCLLLDPQMYAHVCLFSHSHLHWTSLQVSFQDSPSATV